MCQGGLILTRTAAPFTLGLDGALPITSTASLRRTLPRVTTPHQRAACAVGVCVEAHPGLPPPRHRRRPSRRATSARQHMRWSYPKSVTRAELDSKICAWRGALVHWVCADAPTILLCLSRGRRWLSSPTPLGCGMSGALRAPAATLSARASRAMAVCAEPTNSSTLPRAPLGATTRFRGRQRHAHPVCRQQSPQPCQLQLHALPRRWIQH